MKFIHKIILLLVALGMGISFAQNPEDKLRGHSIYEKYDKSFLTPEFRGKHSVSLGPVLSAYGPRLVNFEPSFGLHLGYNYLILQRRNLKKANKKAKYRNEVKFGIGLHATILENEEFIGSLSFFRPLSKTNGKLLNWIFFSEYNIGFHKTVESDDNESEVRFNLNLELFRMRFSGIPLYFKGAVNYDLKNNLLNNARLNAGIQFGLRYYIYRK